MRHLFIINPAAGKGRTLKYIPEIKKMFLKREDDFKIEITRAPKDAEKIAKKYTQNEKLRVYSVGGDGTLNEVLNGMAGSDSSLAVIPLGTGNDFIRSIVPSYDIKNILKKTIEGKEKLIDCASANGRYFLNISSIGFDADVIHNSLRYKKSAFMPRKLTYVFSILHTFFRYKDKHIKVEIDGCKFDEKIFLIALANGKYYGGGICISPYSKLNDGKMNINFIRTMNHLKILRFAPKLIKGKFENINEVIQKTGRKVRIKSDDRIFMNVDGELVETNEVNFEIVPKKVRIIVPEY